MKRFVGRPWIQRFQLFATGAQRRGDGDAARSTFPSGSIRRLATRCLQYWWKVCIFSMDVFQVHFFGGNPARIKDNNMIITNRYVTVGRFNFQSLIHPGPGASRQARPRRTFSPMCWHPKSWFSSKTLTGGMDSHIFLCSLHSHSHRECCSRCRLWMEFQKLKILLINWSAKRLYTKCDLYLFYPVPTFWDLGKSLGMTWCVVMITQLCCAMCSHMWLMAHRCGSSEGGRHFGGPRPEGKICLWYFVTATLLQKGTQKTTD